MTTVADVVETAWAAHHAGINVLPPKQDGTKAPDVTSWTEYEQRRVTDAEIQRWYSNGRTGVGLVCGPVSGNLELFEFDDYLTYEAFLEAAESAGLIEVVDRIQNGYLEATPGDGIHWLYRTPSVSGNTKLARRLKRTDEMRHEKDRYKVLIESRGAGGFVIIAPSFDGVHPTGNPYRRLQGSVDTIVTLTEDERSELWALARSFDQLPKADAPPEAPRERRQPQPGEEVRPGDDFIERTRWTDVLEPHGWRRVFERGNTMHWRRPGKNAGISATTNHEGSDLLYVFSSSTDFEPERGYSKFAAYAALVHNGDFEAAARQLGDEGYGRPAEPPPGASLLTGDAPRKRYHRTDYGNGERLVDRHGADLHHCHPLKRWYLWDGRRWAPDATAEVTRRAKETVRAMWSEIRGVEDENERKELAKWVAMSEGASRITAMLTMASSELPVPVEIHQLDADPWLLNCANGTVDLRTGALRPHARSDLLTKITPVAFDPSATLDAWDRFLSECTGGDAELEGFLRRAVGYSITGTTSEERLFFMHGPGGSMKSTFAEAVRSAFGEYAATADFETFLARRATGGPREDIARLAGARMVLSIEVDEGRRLAEGLVKTLTGGDTITARELYEKSFEFLPQFALWLVANSAPRVNDDDAIWRRILRVPFEQVIPPERRDPRVKAALRNPAIAGRAVLAWAVRGCLEWQRDGLGVPPSVELATEAYRLDQDPIGGFLADCCILHPDARVPRGQLRQAYDRWAGEIGERTVGGKAFGQQLRKRGVGDCWVNEVRGWTGIGLRAEERSRVDRSTAESTAESPDDPWWDK